jgi:hypothetical protein
MHHKLGFFVESTLTARFDDGRVVAALRRFRAVTKVAAAANPNVSAFGGRPVNPQYERSMPTGTKTSAENALRAHLNTRSNLSSSATSPPRMAEIMTHKSKNYLNRI